MKHFGSLTNDILKALAIVNVFETGKPFGEFATVAVLNDGAGISYGMNQFTHRSGSLAAVVERYLELDGSIGRYILENALPNLRRTEPVIVRAYSRDERVRKTLCAAAVTREMRVAQLQIAFERYLRPAMVECIRFGFDTPLSLAVIYDSITHGSFEKIRDRVSVTPSGIQNRTAEAGTLTEKRWITEYVRLRDRWLASIPRLNATRYRTRFFLNQIALGTWNLKLPLNVNGFWLRGEHIENLLKFADGMIGTELVAGPNFEPPEQSNNPDRSQRPAQALTPTPQARPADGDGSPMETESANSAFDDARASDPSPQIVSFENFGKSVNYAAESFDRADAIISGVAIRTDSVKSLWTAVIGTVWQTAWAIFGFLIGLPRSIWFAAAIIVATLMIFYLYRQITLGKLREQQIRI